jgi:uncharacterized membrane protein YgdD (TMEM256/DUF423 family)
MTHFAIITGAFYCALAIAAGAFGAHGLSSRLDAQALDLWETAARYLMYAGFGLLAVGILDELWHERLLTAAAWSLALGGLIFSGTVFALALGGPRVLGAVTPVGGLLLIAGFLAFAWTAIARHLEG